MTTNENISLNLEETFKKEVLLENNPEFFPIHSLVQWMYKYKVIEFKFLTPSTKYLFSSNSEGVFIRQSSTRGYCNASVKFASFDYYLEKREYYTAEGLIDLTK